MPFAPTEFTQVNPRINRVLVRRAMALLDPRPGERDRATSSAASAISRCRSRAAAPTVVGVEGSAALVTRASENAAANGLAANARFIVANLFAATPESARAALPLAKALIDPPREGAMELARALPRATTRTRLERIVYVSCNPATLARDAGVLVHERGYRLAAAGVVNMFPHTAHVESIALFAR